MAKSEFGDLLRKGRLALGLSLRRAAGRIGVSPTFLSLVENGNSKPTDKIILGAYQITSGISRDELCAAARVLPPDIQVTLQCNPSLWPSVRELFHPTPVPERSEP